MYTAETVTVPASDGTRIPCSLHLAPLQDPTGRTFLLISVFVPI